MSFLTEEQRRRIEENRRKALEKRAQNSSNSVGVSNRNVPPTAQPGFGAGYQKLNITFNSSHCKASKGGNLPSSNSSAINYISVMSKISSLPTHETSSKPKPGGNLFRSNDVIKGHCLLLSRKRFYVDIGYNKEVIDIFKSVPNRLYDMQTKKWNFAIESHDKLMSLLKPLKPNVLVLPLPKNLLNAFIKTEDENELKEYDLSNMDQTLVSALLPFQKIGLYFGIKHGGRVLVADDMGLGKTIQGIAIANYFQKDWPLLIVTPSSVRYLWLDAFHKWLPTVEHHEISIINSGKEHIPNNKVVIMSYDLLTKMKDEIISRKFRSVIFDESHFLKNPKCLRTKAAQVVMKQMNRIIMLSGTPALSRPIELYSQLSALCPRYFSSRVEYGIRYCNGKSMPWGWDFMGSSNMGELQIVLEDLVMIRRLKSEVIKQLPNKYRQTVVLDPSRISTKSKSKMKAIYEKVRERNLKGVERRSALLEYFHKTGEIKIPAVCDYILDLLESEKKFICFAHHQKVMNSICDCIEKKKIDFIRIDGSVSAEERKKLCDHFQLNYSCKVAVLSITAANCGITLTAANLVVFAELFWNPGILTQAEDRAHRIGQEDCVTVQYLVATGTADDEMWPLVQQKLDTLNKAGLSKDNFKLADTVVRNDSTQLSLDIFLEEFVETHAISDSELDCGIPEKRLKLHE